MKVTTTQTGQKEPEQQFYKFYSEQELRNCLNTEHITVKTVLSLIESNFEKDKVISQLTQNVAELTKRVAFLEKKALQKSGRPRQTYWVNGQELTDEYLVELIMDITTASENWKRMSEQVKISFATVTKRQRKK